MLHGLHARSAVQDGTEETNVDKKWELDSAKDGDTRYFVIHGQLPKGINGDFGYPVCDTMNRHHCISPDEDEANAKLIAAAPELLAACEAAVDELIGLRSYLTTCDFGVIRENIDGLAYKMNDVRAKIEAAIRAAQGESL
jgi:hypothetical protein